MPSLNLDLDYFDHPKTRRLVRLLGPGAEILPIRLWVYCGKFHSTDGSLVGYSEDEIEAFAGWAGMKGLMYRAMLSEGFFDVVEGGVVIHDWQEHAGHFAVYHERAKLAAKARWNGASDASSRKTNAYGICNSIGNATLSPKNDASSRKTNAPAGQGRAGNKRAKFTPPSVEEVATEISEKRYTFSASRFVDFYEAKGWMVGKSPMRDWHAAMRTWQASEVERGRKTLPLISEEENERLRIAAREAR